MGEKKDRAPKLEGQTAAVPAKKERKRDLPFEALARIEGATLDAQ